MLKLCVCFQASRKSLQQRVEKVEAKLGATSKLKRNKEDQLEYLMEGLEEARGTLEACHKSRTRRGGGGLGVCLRHHGL